MIDVRSYGAIPDGVTDCATAINNALAVGDIIIQNGIFLIASSIKIPSNRTVYGKNAKIKLADGAYDNIFRNSDFVNGNTNVNIIGLGNFSIDQNIAGNTEGTVNSTHGKRNDGGDNLSYKYICICFYKVTTFQIKGVWVLDHLRHCVTINQSSYGIIDGIVFNVIHNIANQDSFDIGWGCHHITINGIHSWSRDDVFDLICGNLNDYAPSYDVGYNVGDIHDITVTNVNIRDSLAGRCPAIITGYGNKMYNISFSGINLRHSGSLFYNNYTAFHDGAAAPPSKDDVHDFAFDTCTINTLEFDTACFTFGQSIKNFTATNITNNSGQAMYQLVAGDQSDNVTINGVQVI